MQPGDTVAVGAGSRGIANLPVMVKATVDGLRAAGMKPYVVPAMGSHGGATADGQKEMLAFLGVTEESVGAEVRATMEVEQIGQIDERAAALPGQGLHGRGPRHPGQPHQAAYRLPLPSGERAVQDVCHRPGQAVRRGA